MPDSISFPNPGDPGYPGITCQTYAFGWVSGCTNENDEYRGVTNEWFFDESLNAWVSVTENIEEPIGSTGDFVFTLGEGGLTSSSDLNYSNNRLSIKGDVANEVYDYGTQIISSPVTFDFSFNTSNVYRIIFDESATHSFDANILIKNPPTSGYYSEMKMIIENPSKPTDLLFHGLDENDSISVINADGPTQDSYGLGVHVWCVWTIDGGQNYYIYRQNGYGRYWD